MKVPKRTEFCLGGWTLIKLWRWRNGKQKWKEDVTGFISETIVCLV